jgi:hypothetical protein
MSGRDSGHRPIRSGMSGLPRQHFTSALNLVGRKALHDAELFLYRKGLPMKFRLIDMFILAAAVAIFAVLATNYWPLNSGNSQFYTENWRPLFAFYVFLLTTFSLRCFLGRRRSRAFAAGYIAFGWVYFISVLKGGFGVHDNYDMFIHAKSSVAGILYSVLAGIVAYYVLPPAICITRKGNRGDGI